MPVPRVRPYIPADRESCLAVFDANTPQYFDSSERASFVEFLDAPRGRFAVVLDDHGSVIGCGGIIVNQERGEGHLEWGMIAPHRQGQGLGRAFTMERLRWLAEDPAVKRILMDTSQRTVGFYERLGFAVTGHRRDAYGPGLDRIDLGLELNEEARARIREAAGKK